MNIDSIMNLRVTGTRIQGLMRALLLLLPILPVQASSGFGFQQVVDRARERAAEDYRAPVEIPRFLRELSYENYQNIRFDPQRRLWRGSKYQVMLVAPGANYTHPVKINIIDAEGVHPLPFNKSLFTFGDADLERRIPADLGYAGFKLTYPLRGENTANQFLVFAGASYFRGVGRDNNFGISARGIAVNTGLASGEKFPAFVEFWLVRPSPDAGEMMLYALLDGEHLTGAYQFLVSAGDNTRVEVKSVLFPRREVELLGVAPLTSMFFYGENTTRPAGEWRPQVHDSDGLLVQDGNSGEWLWRPLLNPKRMEMDFFKTENVRGFGLLQRDTAFADYQDLEALYHGRPSTWVSPAENWGKGEVVLIQLPTRLETNDNIVAFWHPEKPVTREGAYHFDYTLSFGSADKITDHPLGKAVNTFLGRGDRVGGGFAGGAYRIIVDFAGGGLGKLKGGAPVAGRVTALNEGEVIEQFVEYNAPCGCWRLSILARPAPERPLSLRAFLTREDEALTETWSYRLPRDNDLPPGGGQN